MGLHYTEQHLTNDAEKLKNSQVQHGYLVHLIRRRSHEKTLDAVIGDLEKNCGVKIAFAAVKDGEKFVKLLDGSGIRPLSLKQGD